MPSNQEIIEHLERLLAEFPDLSEKFNGRYGCSDRVKFNSVVTQIEAILYHIYEDGNPQSTRIMGALFSNDIRGLERAEGLIRGTLEVIRHGLLDTIRSQAILEVKSDFIEAARIALEAGYKDTAAALLAVTLEDSVKRLADKSGHPDLLGSEFSVVVAQLFTRGVIERSTKGNLLAFKDLRNAALHAQWGEVSQESTQGLLFFLPAFNERHHV
ncbi:hypothetical protein [Solilutibacter oculi]|uniref:hypothetical protein n=1 Tax=Solilutibacter oculi TaxID=2698682 RepID=UPI0013A601C9|nr:hypothetical protein [Lysobacter oculi]